MPIKYVQLKYLSIEALILIVDNGYMNADNSKEYDSNEVDRILQDKEVKLLEIEHDKQLESME